MAGPYIFVFTGTSGSGRKTIAHRIGTELGIVPVLSCTTREARETNGKKQDYHYITREQFNEFDGQGKFLQTATIGKERYGVLSRELDEPLQNGRHVYLILNSEAATMVKKLYGDKVVRLFIYVDKGTVRERLESKGMSFDVVDRYLEQYTEEVVYRKQCEHVIENVELNRTLEGIRVAIQSHL
ncbi:guanylate kinase [Paenibacillus oenotherae]|uniref:Guanylate kinase n=1 Tax=Paenibacillus oenotherae TaxID=1435645 RepID=A0ABS7D4T0_9BACL|nr:guanylate kinase [Paenibacillus oenotherae]MBW7474925.1 guanylate kinase [Paenibacillus oenotherae]